MRLIHLTDPHLSSADFPLRGRSHYGKRYLGFASWQRRRRFKHRREWLDQLVAAAHAQRPDLILVTGDLVHIGLPEEIEQAGSWLSSLGDPEQVLLVPGNHDNYAADSWDAMTECWGPYLGVSGTADYPLCRNYPDLQIVGASTALPTRPGSACGLLGQSQLLALEHLLAQPRTRPRLLAIHHPPFPGMSGFRKRLRDASALARLANDQSVDLILHGHDHTDREQTVHGVRVFGTGSASYQQGSFRRLDIESGQGGWELSMRLFHRQDDGRVGEVGEQGWQVATA